ncbi:carbohydrate kinase [bacterium]|nr:carbohydrate kinase [bacterium]
MAAVPPHIVAIGEVLWDEFPDGARLGGAPANFAVHCAGLGARVTLVSRVGQDSRGREALDLLRGRGVGVDFVQRDPERPTGWVRVTLRDGRPSYEIVEGVAWDAIEWEARLLPLAQGADVVCFGTLAQRNEQSRGTLRRFLAACGEGCLRALDLNFRQRFHSEEVVRESLRLTDVLKLSDEEVPTLRGYLKGAGDDGTFLNGVRERFGIETAVLTLGAEGCRVLGPEGDLRVPAAPRQVVNTVGAGDAFTAAFVLHRLAGRDAFTCADRGNRAGGYVAAQDSATPELPGEFRVFKN